MTFFAIPWAFRILRICLGLKSALPADAGGGEKSRKGSDTEESYYKQTIEEVPNQTDEGKTRRNSHLLGHRLYSKIRIFHFRKLSLSRFLKIPIFPFALNPPPPHKLNRELAQYVYNKKAPSTGAAKRPDGSPQAIAAIETKQELLNKIHVKNTYIKRLLSENEAHKNEIHQQNEQILMLNVSLKHTAHRLTGAIADLAEQKRQNQAHSGDMTDLHEQLATFREQMALIDEDKRAYKQNVLHLGDEIHRKIVQWNELLKMKYRPMDDVDDVPDEAADLCREPMRAADDRVAAGDSKAAEELGLEVSVLSEAVNKRNAIITEMEALLIDLTGEIAQSATVIQRICKNLSQRETHLASNLEKLRAHLARLLDRPAGSPPNRVEYATQTSGGRTAERKKPKAARERGGKGRKAVAERR